MSAETFDFPSNPDWPDFASLSYRAQFPKWALIEAEDKGTDAMRAAGRMYLPKEEGESDRQYNIRLNRSFLYQMLKDMLDKVVARPFSRPVIIHDREKLPEPIEAMMKDMDFKGRDHSQYLKSNFRKAGKHGWVTTLVDFSGSSEGLNLLQEKQLGLRPYCTEVPATAITGIVTEKLPNGDVVTKQLRIKEEKTVRQGVYGEVLREFRRVITAGPFLSDIDKAIFELQGGDKELLQGTVELFMREDETSKERDGNPWKLVEFNRFSFPGIPVATFYMDQVDLYVAKPPLWIMAELNLEHWQKKSDNDNIVHTAQVPLLFRKGWSKKELEQPIELGSSASAGTTNEKANMEWLEITGAGIEAGAKNLETVEERAEVAGLEPFMRRTGNIVATGLAISAVKETAPIQSWITDEQNYAREVIDLGGVWLKEPVDKSVSFRIFSNFGLSIRASEDIGQLIKMRTAKPEPLIDENTFLNEVRRRALLDEDTENTVIISALKKEAEERAAIAKEIAKANSEADVSEDDDSEETEPETGEEAEKETSKS